MLYAISLVVTHAGKTTNFVGYHSADSQQEAESIATHIIQEKHPKSKVTNVIAIEILEEDMLKILNIETRTQKLIFALETIAKQRPDARRCQQIAAQALNYDNL